MVVRRNKDGVNTNTATRLDVGLVPGDRHKLLYLVGNRLTRVQLKLFADTINASLYSFVDDYEMHSVIQNVLRQIVLGVVDLHGGGFYILNSVYSLFYGGFLQTFQTTMGWNDTG